MIISNKKTSVEQEGQNIIMSVQNKHNANKSNRKISRKMSNLFQRVTEDPSKIIKEKSRFVRKDSSTSQAISITGINHTNTVPSSSISYEENSICSQQVAEEQKLKSQIQKSQNDPFLRSILKCKMQNELKGLNILAKQKLIEDSFIKYIRNQKQNLNVSKVQSLNTSTLSMTQPNRLPKDISMYLNNSFSDKKNVSLKNSGNLSMTSNQALYFSNGQECLKPQQRKMTTLRAESYKAKVQKLQIFQQSVEKQKSFVNLIKESPRHTDDNSLKTLWKSKFYIESSPNLI